MTKRKRTNNDLQNIKQKTKDRATRTPLKTGCELRCSGKVSSSCSTCDIARVTILLFDWTFLNSRPFSLNAHKILNYLAFQSLDFERIWWTRRAH